MSNDVKVFEHDRFQRVRTVIIDGIIYFVLTDICTNLDVKSASQTASELDDDEKLLVDGDFRSMYYIDLNLNPNSTWLVNEAGLYHVIFQSRKPEAKAFRRWVTHEVLPSILKTGSYSVNDDICQKPEQQNLIEHKLVINFKFIEETDFFTRDTVYVLKFSQMVSRPVWYEIANNFKESGINYSKAHKGFIIPRQLIDTLQSKHFEICVNESVKLVDSGI
jgi:prophage antirepressor-like protein